MNDYERVAQVIRFLDGTHSEQPDLRTLAARAGLSPFHFHRLFSTWAGLTPKDFVQCLTVAHARQRLRDGQSVLSTALEAGLSGPGRLHELCVTLEAASPGELKSGGLGWTIAAGVAESPFGTCVLAESPRGLCHLSFIEPAESRAALAMLQAEWPRACVRRHDRLAARWADRIFVRPTLPVTETRLLRAFVRGTAFQVRVWRALLQVPVGALVTYGDLAAVLGQAGAARAVGTAVGRNPLAYLIPCHRVIRETGVIGGYRWGPVRKRAILAWESRFSETRLPSQIRM